MENIKKSDSEFEKEQEHNQSELSNNKNVTLKKIQFYVITIFGIILVIAILFSLVKNLTTNSKKEEVKEVEKPKVQSLQKENLFLEQRVEDKYTEINPFIEKEPKKETIEEDVFSPTTKEKVLKAQIIKGATTAVITGANNKNISNSYDEQIKELEIAKDKLNAGETKESNKDFEGDVFSPTVAKMNEFNPDLLLPKGTYIGCSIDTRFVSSIQGSTSCTVSQNVYSSNGNVLLIEKGSKLFGTYKGDQANDGTSRYFVIWQEVRTPNHLRIPLNSGASDELGGAGLEGEIDHKWLMRFGSSIMLSAVDDAFNVLAWKLTNQNNSSNNTNNIDYSENSRENASKIASIALEKFINIKPTIYKQHGDLVGVYVNRDVDFSKVYRLSKKAK
ncbi:type IV secretion system protein VirB10 [Aliarcobacter butzleri]|uniref:type IV secretion system protein VirB10 n=1 Tax=Aliarcobacter butzleri TaxID=28197 RepID=UPI003AF567CA